MAHPVLEELNRIQAELDTQKLSKKFKLQQAGGGDGTHNRPDQNSTTMSPTEIELSAYVNELASKAYGKVVQALQALRADLDTSTADLNVEQDIETIRNSGQHLSPNVMVETDRNKTEIIWAAKAYGSLERSFREFQVNNNLTSRVPSYPVSKTVHLKWLWIGMVAEFALAFPFYLEVANNALSAFLFSFLMVILNVMLAFIAAYLFRYINHVSLPKKVGYTTLSVICFVLFLIAILMAGHLRTAISVVLSREGLDTFDLMRAAGEQGFRTLTSDPLAVGGDIVPLMFLIASFGFGLFTAWKAYTVDDEYPKYGDIDRQKNNSYSVLDEKTKGLFSSLDKVYKDSFDHTKRTFDHTRTKYTNIIVFITEYRNLLEAFGRFHDQATINLNASVQIYRAANNFVRNSSPPRYFEDELTIESVSHESLPSVRDSDLALADSLTSAMDKLMTVYSSTLAEMKSSQKALYEELAAEIRKIRDLAVRGEAVHVS